MVVRCKRLKMLTFYLKVVLKIYTLIKTLSHFLKHHLENVAGDEKSFQDLPGGVPQHNLLSSMCLTSIPINQAPKETSSFAYLCRTCLKHFNTYIEKEEITFELKQDIIIISS